MKTILTSIFLVAMLSCQKDDPTPVPEISFDVIFHAKGKVGFNTLVKNVDSIKWDFGDGGFSTEILPTHQYKANGEYDVSVSVVGAGGKSGRNALVTITNIP